MRAIITMAFRSLLAHKMRSALTMLGIVIGIAAVITVVAVGRGAERQVAAQLKSLGANLLLVTPGAVQREGVRLESGSSLTLTEDDAIAIFNRIPSVVAVGSFISGRAQVIAANRNWSTLIAGVTPHYVLARDWNIADGGPLLGDHIANASKVVVIGKTVARELFGTARAVGQQVRIKNTPFVVIGVLAAKGQNAAGRDQDDVVLMPITTARIRILGRSPVSAHSLGGILVKVHVPEAMDAVRGEITALLRRRHHLLPQQQDDFRIQNLADVARAREAALSQFTIMLAIIASVALIVGGVGVMNTMLVSIGERIREIGIRLAVGAEPRNIMWQFLAEAGGLAMVSGIVGIVAGYGAAFLVTATLGWPTAVEPVTIFLALGVSAATGMVFGLYPAYSAASLDPAHALRSE